MNTRISPVQRMVFCAISAALLAVCAWITVPAPNISFTLQNFALYLILFVFGGRIATVSCAVYLAVGAAGLPVFSGFQGAAALLGASGGYLWGFLLMCLLYWAVTALWGSGPKASLLAAVAGTFVCYLCGSLWFWLLYTDGSPASFMLCAAKCVLPFLLPDALKLLLALRLSPRLKNALFFGKTPKN